MGKPKYLGFKNQSLYYGDYEVTSYLGKGKYEVTFYNGYTTIAMSKEIRNGNIKNKNHPHIYGIGYIGEGIYKCSFVDTDGKHNTPEYEAWRGIIRRCYSEENKSYPVYGARGVVVSEDWHNFQVFAEWYTSQKAYYKRWHLDKDLVDYQSKLYSEEYCTLVPKEINSLFTGGFKTIVQAMENGKWKVQMQKGDKCSNGEKRQTFLGYYSTKEQALDVFFEEKAAIAENVAIKNKELLDKRVYLNLTNKEWVKNYVIYLSKQEENVCTKKHKY